MEGGAAHPPNTPPSRPTSIPAGVRDPVRAGVRYPRECAIPARVRDTCGGAIPAGLRGTCEGARYLRGCVAPVGMRDICGTARYLRFRKWGPGFEHEPPVGGRRGADGGPIDHPTPTTRTHPPASGGLIRCTPTLYRPSARPSIRVSISPLITTAPRPVRWDGAPVRPCALGRNNINSGPACHCIPDATGRTGPRPRASAYPPGVPGRCATTGTGHPAPAAVPGRVDRPPHPTTHRTVPDRSGWWFMPVQSFFLRVNYVSPIFLV